MIKNLFEKKTLESFTNEKWFKAYHRVFAKKIKKIAALRAFKKIASSAPDDTYDIYYFPWDVERKLYDITKFKETNVNSTLKQDDLINVKPINIFNIFFRFFLFFRKVNYINQI